MKFIRLNKTYDGRGEGEDDEEGEDGGFFVEEDDGFSLSLSHLISFFDFPFFFFFLHR